MTKKFPYGVFSLLLMFVALFAVGCQDKMGGTFPMTIKVMMDGVPLEGATVALVQLTGDGHAAVGRTDASGLAQIKASEGLGGVFPGEYTVTIKKIETTTSSTPPPGKTVEIDKTTQSDIEEEEIYVVSNNLLPAKYGSVSTSEMKVTQGEEKSHHEFDLSSTEK